MSLAAAPGRRMSRIPPLLRETAFRRYWGAQSVSLFGDQVSSIALPLAAVLALHASPADMGYLSALIWLPSLLFALHAGAWVDRRGHRRATMIAADLGRAVLLASIPVCSALGVLTLAQLFAVAFAAGTLSIFFTVSDAGLFVALVPGDRYVEGNSLIYQSRALAAVAGPSVGGLLVQALSAPFALAADALSFLGSALFLGRIRPAEPAPDQDRRRGALSAGARFIWTSAILRPSLACVSIINFFSFMFMGGVVGGRGGGRAARAASGAVDRRRGRHPGLPVPASLADAALPAHGAGETVTPPPGLRAGETVTPLPAYGAGETEPGGGIVPGPVTLQTRAPGSVSTSGLASTGGCLNAGWLRSSMSSIGWAFASRRVRAGMFHLASRSAQMLVWSNTVCET